MMKCFKKIIPLIAGSILLTTTSAFSWEIKENSNPQIITGVHHEFNTDYVVFYLKSKSNPYDKEKVVKVFGLNDAKIKDMVANWKDMYSNGQTVKWMRNNSIRSTYDYNWVNSAGQSATLKVHEVKAGNDFFYRY